MIISLCACGQKSSYAGTYEGSEGSIMVLNKDGTCRYKDGNGRDTTDGTWGIEDNKLYVSVPDSLDYEIYAELGDNKDSLLFESDNSTWIDELFSKQDS